MTGLSLIALSRRLDTRKRIDALIWKARAAVVREQLIAMRGSW